MESFAPLLHANRPSNPWTNKLKLRRILIFLLTTAFVLTYNATKFRNKIPYIQYHDLFRKMGHNSNDSIAQHLRILTREPHLAGTPENFATADYVLSTFQKAGLDAHCTDYEVLLTYPLSRSISVSLPDGELIPLKLKEDQIDGDPSTSNPKVIPTFHAYSPSGNVSASVVFANYGRAEDYAVLREFGVDLQGSVVIAKYGKTFRGNIVKLAAKAGAVAVAVYSDPRDFGGNRTEGSYPQSMWLPPSGVQRGSVFQEIGDPLTPGWPSVPDGERLSLDDPTNKLPAIPSIPISAEDAALVMKSLEGPLAPPEWDGALDLPVYRLGRGPGVLSFQYEANHTITRIRNVFGLIKGSQEPQRYVLLGNHRDAWTFGAGDPSGGTAALLEIAQRFGKLLKQGWQPRRSILFCNWDAEEYGLVGSTEWVEENYDLLYSSAVAYLNIDAAVIGAGQLIAKATPQLDALVQEIAKEVEDPDNPEKTIYESWVASTEDFQPYFKRVGGKGSDYASFVQHVGIPATDFMYGQDFPVYHSLYDDYMWMENFGDPLFHRHAAMAAMWGLVALRLIDAKLLPFNYSTYADELESYVDILEIELKAASSPPSHVTTMPLHKSIAELRKAALDVLKKTQGVEVLEEENLKMRSLNDHLIMAERAFTDADGLPGNPWYKHLVYGPTKANGYGTASFPGISELIATVASGGNNSVESWDDVQHQIWRVSRAISRVALVLHGKFT